METVYKVSNLPREMSNPTANKVMDFEEPDEALLDDTDPEKTEIDKTTKGNPDGSSDGGSGPGRVRGRRGLF